MTDSPEVSLSIIVNESFFPHCFRRPHTRHFRSDWWRGGREERKKGFKSFLIFSGSFNSYSATCIYFVIIKKKKNFFLIFRLFRLIPLIMIKNKTLYKSVKYTLLFENSSNYILSKKCIFMNVNSQWMINKGDLWTIRRTTKQCMNAVCTETNFAVKKCARIHACL